MTEMADLVEDGWLDATGIDQADLDVVIGSVALALDGEARPDQVVTLGGKAWRPHVLAGERVVHVQAEGEVPGFARRRLAASPEHGFQPVLAATVGVLFDEDLMGFLVENDVEVVVVDPDGSVRDATAPLTAIASELEVSPDLRRHLASRGWALCREEAASHVKGRRLEGLLAFLLSQVDGLEVRSINFRTETEEIDIVVRQRGVGMRTWQLAGAPLILVEAKNWHSAKVTQKEFSAFLTKIEGKRGTVRIGLLVATLGFTEDARQQELRGSRNGDITVVLVGPEELAGWVAADDGDAFLEELVEDAMLR